MDSTHDNGAGISIQGEKINNLQFVEDIDLRKKQQRNITGKFLLAT
jgi:hypothetical protein